VIKTTIANAKYEEFYPNIYERFWDEGISSIFFIEDVVPYKDVWLRFGNSFEIIESGYEILAFLATFEDERFSGICSFFGGSWSFIPS
jgi:hypothetical protein